MRLILSFISDKKIVLPKGYFGYIQGLIYNLLEKADAKWLHEEGFKYEKRKFKLFVFSEINERGIIKNGKFFFPEKITFSIASPVDWILEQVAKNVILGSEVKLGGNILSLSEIRVLPRIKVKSNEITVKTLSPIEVHSTLLKEDGAKKTYYYNPRENEFSDLIESNLKRKWEILNKRECPYSVEIFPLMANGLKERTILLKGTVIKGWKGRFILKGDKELLSLAFEAGLGTRNSLGFGFIEEVVYD